MKQVIITQEMLEALVKSLRASNEALTTIGELVLSSLDEEANEQ